jgi:nucleoid DNA-binding protein
LSRADLIKQLKKNNPNLNHSELKTIIDVFSESIFNALKEGNTIEIRGFGRWYCKKLKENFNLRNPATNELIYKPKRVKVRFRPSKKLNNIINE